MAHESLHKQLEFVSIGCRRLNLLLQTHIEVFDLLRGLVVQRQHAVVLRIHQVEQELSINEEHQNMAVVEH